MGWRRGDNLTDQRLSDQSVALIIKRRGSAAAVGPELLSGHSLRAGYATAAAAAGVEERKIANVTRHRTCPSCAATSAPRPRSTTSARCCRSGGHHRRIARLGSRRSRPNAPLASGRRPIGSNRGGALAVRLEWEGKPTQVERLALPFQTVETINESRATRERDTGALFGGGRDGARAARNLLIWGDNKLVMSSLLRSTRARSSWSTSTRRSTPEPTSRIGVKVGEADRSTKLPSILEEHAYRDTWGRGRASYLPMIYERLVLIHELLADDGSLYLHCAPNVSHYRQGRAATRSSVPTHFRNEIVWKRTSAHSDMAGAKHSGGIHETILLYTQGRHVRTWNTQFTPVRPRATSKP